MEDISPDMHLSVRGEFEPEGICIWINTDFQSDLSSDPSNVGEISHEFAHYTQAVSTLWGIHDLLNLLFMVHSGIQRIEDVKAEPILPLKEWASKYNAPDFIKKFYGQINKRKEFIQRSYGSETDKNPTKIDHSLPIYQKRNRWHLAVRGIPGHLTRGVHLGRLTLMEGMAVAAKSESLGNINDINNKIEYELWHYVAPYLACKECCPNGDPLILTKFLCDIALCSPTPSGTFIKGLRKAKSMPSNSYRENYLSLADDLYKEDCAKSMENLRQEVEKQYDNLPPDHKGEIPSWTYVILKNVVSALKKRESSPLSIASPVYHGDELLALANEIGSPVILTNDMRLSLLNDEKCTNVHRAIFQTRTISKLCEWVVEGGKFACPYSGCPGCPPARVSSSCNDNALEVIVSSETLPWCALFFSAQQLRIRNVVKKLLASNC